MVSGAEGEGRRRWTGWREEDVCEGDRGDVGVVWN